jgi:hypothetical protein
VDRREIERLVDKRERAPVKKTESIGGDADEQESEQPPRATIEHARAL